jgi:hypothetical protein
MVGRAGKIALGHFWATRKVQEAGKGPSRFPALRVDGAVSAPSRSTLAGRLIGGEGRRFPRVPSVLKPRWREVERFGATSRPLSLQAPSLQAVKFPASPTQWRENAGKCGFLMVRDTGIAYQRKMTVKSGRSHSISTTGKVRRFSGISVQGSLEPLNKDHLADLGRTGD